MTMHSPFAQSRRNGRRFPFFERVTIQTSDCQTFLAQDVSLSGIGVKGCPPAETGSDLLVKFEFVQDHETYFARARVRWSSENGFGIAFEELGNYAERGILSYITRNQSDSSD